MLTHFIGLLFRGEIENGLFGSNGSGWKEYPEIEDLLNPVHDANDGVFWVSSDISHLPINKI